MGFHSHIRIKVLELKRKNLQASEYWNTFWEIQRLDFREKFQKQTLALRLEEKKFVEVEYCT